METPKPDYSVPALEKGLDILEFLSTCHGPLKLTDLARRLGRRNNEIFRMLNLLERREYVLRDQAGAYRLSLKMFQMVRTQNPLAEIISSALPPMQRLSEGTGESCHLSVLEGSHIVILANVPSPKPVRLSVEVGGRFSAISTASGRALLAGLPPETVVAILRDAKTRPSPRRELLVRLAEIQKLGHSFAHGDTLAGVVDQAMAFGNPFSGVHAAVAISALHSGHAKPDPRSYALPLRRCITEIQRAIGSIQSLLKKR